MNSSYSTSFAVDQSPEEVYAAINNVREWWSGEIEGSTNELGQFNYGYKDMHRCTIQITELVPGKRIVWHIADNYFNFAQDKNEWKDTDILFEINSTGDRTEVRFTHEGLVPSYECYNVCSDAWGGIINGNLQDLITKHSN